MTTLPIVLSMRMPGTVWPLVDSRCGEPPLKSLLECWQPPSRHVMHCAGRAPGASGGVDEGGRGHRHRLRHDHQRHHAPGLRGEPFVLQKIRPAATMLSCSHCRMASALLVHRRCMRCTLQLACSAHVKKAV